MRVRSYSPSPPRGGYSRRRDSPSPRGWYSSRGSGRDPSTSLLVRNLRHDCRPEDLRWPFGQIGPLKDIYLPRDTLVHLVDLVSCSDASDAKHQMDHGWSSFLQGEQEETMGVIL